MIHRLKNNPRVVWAGSVGLMLAIGEEVASMIRCHEDYKLCLYPETRPRSRMKSAL